MIHCIFYGDIRIQQLGRYDPLATLARVTQCVLIVTFRELQPDLWCEAMLCRMCGVQQILVSRTRDVTRQKRSTVVLSLGSTQTRVSCPPPG